MVGLTGSNHTIAIPDGIENRNEVKESIELLLQKIKYIRDIEEKYLSSLEKDIYTLTSNNLVEKVNSNTLDSTDSFTTPVFMSFATINVTGIPVANESLEKWRSVLFDQALDIEYLHESYTKSPKGIREHRKNIELLHDLEFYEKKKEGEDSAVRSTKKVRDTSFYARIKQILFG